ncbi:unnamed protein product [Caenorhabditis sp. 36 PRJEB53466]|nr:unnamed protein product [Caenorhabditis sp. 36 PRJEB53466]
MADDYCTDQFKATQLFDEITWHLRAHLPVKTNRKDIVLTAEQSFFGKEALEFLIAEMPRIVPEKVPTKENMEKFLDMMLEWKVIAEAFPKKPPRKRAFNETRLYKFAKTLDELKKPKPRSRRSASFSGARKSAKVARPMSPAATMHRMPKSSMNRRLSRSNGNVDKAGVEPNPDPRGVENHGFEDRKEDPPPPPPVRQRAPKILNRSLESICVDNEPEEMSTKEKVYDWLPFFKSKRAAHKSHQPTRRSVSLDRNHCVVQQEAQALAQAQAKAQLQSQGLKKVNTPPTREASTEVFLHPKGPLQPEVPLRQYQNHRNSLVAPSILLARGRMYESIMRRSSVAPIEERTVHKNADVWKNELLVQLGKHFDTPLPLEWTAKLDSNEIAWNSQEIDPKDGLVRSKWTGSQQEYPPNIIQFMDYLGRYPFAMPKKNSFVQEPNVIGMFSTLVNRLEDLHAPLYPDECVLLVELLSKVDRFAVMLGSGAVRRWSRVMSYDSASSIEEAGLMADGFARELPQCAARASKHRRRALSPYNDRISISIQDEKVYKIREPWLIEAIQLILISLPTARRRKLHKFMQFIKSVATNEVFDIADPSNGSSTNREAAIIGLWTGVCGGFRKNAGLCITAVLLANHRSLFAVPFELSERVHYLEQRVEDRSRYEKASRGRRGRQQVMPEVSEIPVIPKRNEKEKKGLFTRLLRK